MNRLLPQSRADVIIDDTDLAAITSERPAASYSPFDEIFTDIAAQPTIRNIVLPQKNQPTQVMGNGSVRSQRRSRLEHLVQRELLAGDILFDELTEPQQQALIHIQETYNTLTSSEARQAIATHSDLQSLWEVLTPSTNTPVLSSNSANGPLGADWRYNTSHPSYDTITNTNGTFTPTNTGRQASAYAPITPQQATETLQGSLTLTRTGAHFSNTLGIQDGHGGIHFAVQTGGPRAANVYIRQQAPNGAVTHTDRLWSSFQFNEYAAVDLQYSITPTGLLTGTVSAGTHAFTFTHQYSNWNGATNAKEVMVYIPPNSQGLQNVEIGFTGTTSVSNNIDTFLDSTAGQAMVADVAAYTVNADTFVGAVAHTNFPLTAPQVASLQEPSVVAVPTITATGDPLLYTNQLLFIQTQLTQEIANTAQVATVLTSPTVLTALQQPVHTIAVEMLQAKQRELQQVEQQWLTASAAVQTMLAAELPSMIPIAIDLSTGTVEDDRVTMAVPEINGTVVLQSWQAANSAAGATTIHAHEYSTTDAAFTIDLSASAQLINAVTFAMQTTNDGVEIIAYSNGTVLPTVNVTDGTVTITAPNDSTSITHIYVANGGNELTVSDLQLIADEHHSQIATEPAGPGTMRELALLVAPEYPATQHPNHFQSRTLQNFTPGTQTNGHEVMRGYKQFFTTAGTNLDPTLYTAITFGSYTGSVTARAPQFMTDWGVPRNLPEGTYSLHGNTLILYPGAPDYVLWSTNGSTYSHGATQAASLAELLPSNTLQVDMSMNTFTLGATPAPAQWMQSSPETRSVTRPIWEGNMGIMASVYNTSGTSGAMTIDVYTGWESEPYAHHSETITGSIGVGQTRGVHFVANTFGGNRGQNDADQAMITIVLTMPDGSTQEVRRTSNKQHATGWQRPEGIGNGDEAYSNTQHTASEARRIQRMIANNINAITTGTSSYTTSYDTTQTVADLQQVATSVANGNNVYIAMGNVDDTGNIIAMGNNDGTLVASTTTSVDTASDEEIEKKLEELKEGEKGVHLAQLRTFHVGATISPTLAEYLQQEPSSIITNVHYTASSVMGIQITTVQNSHGIGSTLVSTNGLSADTDFWIDEHAGEAFINSLSFGQALSRYIGIHSTALNQAIAQSQNTPIDTLLNAYNTSTNYELPIHTAYADTKAGTVFQVAAALLNDIRYTVPTDPKVDITDGYLALMNHIEQQTIVQLVSNATGIPAKEIEPLLPLTPNTFINRFTNLISRHGYAYLFESPTDTIATVRQLEDGTIRVIFTSTIPLASLPVIQKHTTTGVQPLLDDGINELYADFSPSRLGSAGEIVTVHVTLPLSNGQTVEQDVSIEVPESSSVSWHVDLSDLRADNMTFRTVSQNEIIPTTYDHESLSPDKPSIIFNSENLSATANWNAVSNASKHRLYVFSQDNIRGAYIEFQNLTSSTTISNLRPGNTYYFGLATIDSEGNVYTPINEQIAVLFVPDPTNTSITSSTQAQPSVLNLKDKIYQALGTTTEIHTSPVVRFQRNYAALSDHATGRAIDIFKNSNNENELIEANTLISSLLTNYGEHVDYILWNGQVFYSNGTSNQINDNLHYDHIHISFKSSANSISNFDLLVI